MKNWKTTNQSTTSNKAEMLSAEEAMLTQLDEAQKLVVDMLDKDMSVTKRGRTIEASMFGAAEALASLCIAITTAGKELDEPEVLGRLSIFLKGVMDSDIIKETRKAIEDGEE